MLRINAIRFSTAMGTEEAVCEFFERETGFLPELQAATTELRWQFDVVGLTDTATLAEVFQALEAELP